MSLFNFIKSRLFLIQIGLAFVAAIVLYIVFVYTLDFYTDHGEKVVVPDFTKLTIADATELANEAGLVLLVTDTTYGSEQERGLISTQTPDPKSEIKSGRTVYITINSLKAEMVSMPNFVGASLRQAQADAQIFGIKIGALTYVPDIAKNNVLKQKVAGKDILPGTKIAKGTLIDLTLGMGLSNEKVYVPLLLRHTLTQADSMLQEHYLNIGAKFYDETVLTRQDSSRALIYKQSPQPMSRNFSPGDFVDIWFTVDTSKILIRPEWHRAFSNVTNSTDLDDE